MVCNSLPFCPAPAQPCCQLLAAGTSSSLPSAIKKFDAVTKKAKVQAFGKSEPLTAKAETRRLEDIIKAAQGIDDEKRVKELLRKK